MAARITPEQTVRMLDIQRRGRTHEQIAAELGLARETVSRRLSQLNREAAKRAAKRADEEIGRQLGQLDLIYQEAFAAWDRSLEDAVSEKTIEDADPEEGDPTTRHERTVKGQSGNPALLAQARGALADKRSLLALDAPQKLSHSDPDGSPVFSGFLEALKKAYGGDSDNSGGSIPAPGPLPEGGA